MSPQACAGPLPLRLSTGPTHTKTMNEATHQFSVRSLFTATLAVAGLLTFPFDIEISNEERVVRLVFSAAGVFANQNLAFGWKRRQLGTALSPRQWRANLMTDAIIFALGGICFWFIFVARDV